MLLLDEPLSALDPFLRIKVREELKRLQRELGISFIHVTHSQDEAMAMADLMVVMEDGEIRQAGPPREVFERPASAFIARFIGGHNVLPSERGLIAVRADRCRLGAAAGRRPHVSGRVAAVEYQGAMVRVALATDGGEEASALLPDGDFLCASGRAWRSCDAGVVGARRACSGGGLRRPERGNPASFPTISGPLASRFSCAARE